MSAKKNVDRHSGPIDGASILKTVESHPDIQDFDHSVEIIDSIVIDHISEDDKSITSDEVTYERWTEETKLTKTNVLDKNGNVVDEIYQSKAQPELIGNILREKLIERHEHIKHVSQDVLKRIKVKSLSENDSDSLKDESNVLIIKPSSSVTTQLANRQQHTNNTYYIQHQQIISPIEGTVSLTKNPHNNNSPMQQSHAVLELSASTPTLFASTNNNTQAPLVFAKKRSPLPNYHLTPLMYCSKSTCLSKLLEQEENYSKVGGSVDCDEINPDLPIAEIVDDANKRFIVQNHFRIANKKTASSSSEESFTDEPITRGLVESCLSAQQSLLCTKNTNHVENASKTNQFLSDSSFTSSASSSKSLVLKPKDERSGQDLRRFEVLEMEQDKTTSDSLESMGRFKRPTRVEMRRLNFQTVRPAVEDEVIEYEDGTEECSNLEQQQQQQPVTNAKYFMVSSSQATSSPVNNIAMVRKSLDMTDVSDTEDVFNRTTNCSEASFSAENCQRQRRTPLRRESFEMAQKSDSVTKRLGLGTSLKQQQQQQRADKREESISSLSTSTESSSNQQQSTQGFSSLHDMDNGESAVNARRRRISEIKPVSPSGDKSNVEGAFGAKEGSGNQATLVDTSNDNESDSSGDASLLKRNYELLRKKSSERSHAELEGAEENVLMATTFLRPAKCEDTLSKVGAKVKIGKRSTGNRHVNAFELASSVKSIRPQLVRGPDIIETIETTTSMSFIMNKNITLTYEEKRIPAAAAAAAASEPLFNSRETNSSSLQRSGEYDSIWDNNNKNSTPIPITIQSRSRSEPRIESSPIDLNLSGDAHVINYPPIASSPKIPQKSFQNISFQRHNGSKHSGLMTASTNFAARDLASPEIRESMHTPAAYSSSFCQQSSNFSRSVPNLLDEAASNYGSSKHLRLDSWNKWPEYAVDQDTDSSVHSVQDSNYQWTKNHKQSDNDFRIDIGIEQRRDG